MKFNKFLSLSAVAMLMVACGGNKANEENAENPDSGVVIEETVMEGVNAEGDTVTQIEETVETTTTPAPAPTAPADNNTKETTAPAKTKAQPAAKTESAPAAAPEKNTNGVSAEKAINQAKGQASKIQDNANKVLDDGKTKANNALNAAKAKAGATTEQGVQTVEGAKNAFGNAKNKLQNQTQQQNNN